MPPNAPVRIGFLGVEFSVSDETDERLAPLTLLTFLTQQLGENWEPVVRTVHLPSQTEVEEHLCRFINEEGCLLVFTLGGIGPTSTDVVSDAIHAVCPKRFPGFSERIRQDARTFDLTALLLRPTAATRQQSLVVGLPAESKLLQACLPALFPAIPNAVFLASGRRIGPRKDT